MFNPVLEINLYDETGKVKATVKYQLEPLDDRQQINTPPADSSDPTTGFEECVHQMKLRHYRDVSFEEIGKKLGRLLAERLSDMEGWHGKDRQLKLNNLTNGDNK